MKKISVFNLTNKNSCDDSHRLSNGMYRFDAKCRIDRCKPGLVLTGIPAKESLTIKAYSEKLGLSLVMAV